MPRTKCKKVNKDNILHMKTIKTRLIKISMKVENYIYKQKMISSVQAKDFLDEILSYEPQCDGDAHCFQVIEKLRRHLSIVISNEDSNKSNVINNVNSLDLNEEEIVNISSPTLEEVNQNVSGNEYFIHNDNNQCNLPNLNKEYTEDITRTNKNENEMQVEEIPTENTKIGIHKNSELNSTSLLEFNTDKMSDINNTPLDLTKPVKNSITYNLNQTRNTSKPKPVVKAVETVSIITEVSQKFNLLELNEKINQDKPKKCKAYKRKRNTNLNSKIKHGQPSKAMQGCTNIQFTPSNVLVNSHDNSVETNIVATVEEGKAKDTLNKNRMDFIDICNQFCERNKITMEKVHEDNVKKIETEKKKNKRKSKNDCDLEERVKKEDKNAKRILDKNKSIETTNVKKIKTKQKLKKDGLKLDLSWFDTIKYIRQVDEQEYFTTKDSNNGCQK